jgi:hypothetical protein
MVACPQENAIDAGDRQALDRVRDSHLTAVWLISFKRIYL